MGTRDIKTLENKKGDIFEGIHKQRICIQQKEEEEKRKPQKSQMKKRGSRLKAASNEPMESVLEAH